MRARLTLVPLLVPLLATVAVGLLAVAGCTDNPTPKPALSGPGPESVRPALGGVAPDPHSPPTKPMDSLERPVHARLAAQVARQGLTLAYLDCPRWNGTVPTLITCRGYVDGLVARVRVRLKAAVEGRAVSFDARLLGGVISTWSLEGTLRRRGWTGVDCGDQPAYPARVGAEIVCHVERASGDRFVVATVTDGSGAVMVADYEDAKSSS